MGWFLMLSTAILTITGIGSPLSFFHSAASLHSLVQFKSAAVCCTICCRVSSGVHAVGEKTFTIFTVSNQQPRVLNLASLGIHHALHEHVDFAISVACSFLVFISALSFPFPGLRRFSQPVLNPLF